MGLERLAAVVQGKKSNFETDLFTSILAAIDQELKTERISLDPKKRLVIADHIRAIVFSINDGVIRNYHSQYCKYVYAKFNHGLYY